LIKHFKLDKLNI